MKRAAVSNPDVGEQIGMTHTGVSRLRSGDRHPSVAIMLAIERAFDWPIGDQVQARQANDLYAVQFEVILARKYGWSDADAAVTA